ncbi:hypothetical protein BU17DRAFT_93141 [Hysterangium stoloniferum]|nr:hypothetical protein BU17DRAFT_93141 [Hysterangium stoloniferum]
MLFSAIHTPPNSIFSAAANPTLLSHTILQAINEFISMDDDLLEMRPIAAKRSREAREFANQPQSGSSLSFLQGQLASTPSAHIESPESAGGVRPSINFNIFMGLDADDEEGRESCTVKGRFKTATTPSTSSESSVSTPRSAVKTSAVFVEDDRSDDTASFTSQAMGDAQEVLRPLVQQRRAAARASVLLKAQMEGFNDGNEPARLVSRKSKRVETDDEEEPTKESAQGVRRSKKPKHQTAPSASGIPTSGITDTSISSATQHRCSLCNVTFTRKDDLKRHNTKTKQHRYSCEKIPLGGISFNANVVAKAEMALRRVSNSYLIGEHLSFDYTDYSLILLAGYNRSNTVVTSLL